MYNRISVSRGPGPQRRIKLQPLYGCRNMRKLQGSKVSYLPAFVRSHNLVKTSFRLPRSV